MVIKKGRVVGQGFNKIKTHPKLFKDYGFFSQHAECVAIMKAAEGDTLIVVRVMRNGKLTCSRPCERCMRFIKDYNIKRIYFSDWDGEMKELKV